jgi:enoyl-CoA hydratase/carnithine racemase
MSELAHYRVDRAIATITLDSPDNRNALSAKLVAEATAVPSSARCGCSACCGTSSRYRSR